MGLDTLVREAPERYLMLDELTIRRALTEVEHLNRLRLPDGTHHPAVEEAILANLIPAVKEAAIPHAQSTIYQQARNGQFWWLDQTSGQVAASGYAFHEHPEALARVDIEVDEDIDACTNLRPGYAKIFISPRISPHEASRTVAEEEHLADDDMVRIHWLDVDENGRVKGKYIQSALIRDVPLAAWNRLLNDGNGLFEVPIDVVNPLAARSVMEAHRAMHVPASRVSSGVSDVIDAVLPHVQAIDSEAAISVETQRFLLTSDQDALHEHATVIAKRWLVFEKQLADSLYIEEVTPPIQQFIDGIINNCSDDFLALLDHNTGYDGVIKMTSKLAAVVERMRQNTLWTSAGVVTGNKRVIEQLPTNVYQAIYTNELFMQQLMANGADQATLQAVENRQNDLIAKENVDVGGGCPGRLGDLFKSHQEAEKNKDDTEVLKCVTCPLCGKKGVDAHIKHEKLKKTITCSSCKKSKVYKV